MSHLGWAVLFGVVIFADFIEDVFAGSCKEAKLCCTGRDSACVVQKTSPNAIIQTLSDKPCYCDHACLKLGDCCLDFKEACGGQCSKSFYYLFIDSFIGRFLI